MVPGTTMRCVSVPSCTVASSNAGGLDLICRQLNVHLLIVDALRRPSAAFVAASKQTKPIWLIITGVASAIGLGTAASTGFAAIGILSVAAFVAAAVYLTDVRPRVREFRGGGSGPSRQGPYGPW